MLRGAVALRASPASRLRPRPSPRPAGRVPRLASRRCLLAEGRARGPLEQPSAPWPAPGVLS